MILYFALDDFWLFFKSKHPCKNSCRIDPEGGHMFIEELIRALLSTLKAVVCDNSNTFDRLRGRLVGNIPYYKHSTAFGVVLSGIFLTINIRPPSGSTSKNLLTGH